MAILAIFAVERVVLYPSALNAASVRSSGLEDVAFLVDDYGDGSVADHVR